MLSPTSDLSHWPLIWSEDDIGYQELQRLKDDFAWLIGEHENFKCDGLFGNPCGHCHRIVGDEDYGMNLQIQLNLG